MFPKLPAPPTKNTKIEKVEARTIREWKTQGFDPSKDRLLGSIDLGDDEYRILITVPSNGVVIYTRRTPQGLTIAGFWG